MKKGKGVFFILSLVLISFMIFGSLNFLSACSDSWNTGYGCHLEYWAATGCSGNELDQTSECWTTQCGGCKNGGNGNVKSVSWTYTGRCPLRNWNCDSVTGANYCSGGNVYHDVTPKSCGSSYGACSTGSSTAVLVEACTYGCTSGVCNSQPVCSTSCYAASEVNCGVAITDRNNCGTGACTGTGTYCASGTCIGGACKSVGSTYWTNLANPNPIANSQLGDTVRMVAAGAGFSGQQINYTVYKNTTFLYFWRWVTPISSVLSSDLWTTKEVTSGAFFKAKVNGLENASTILNIASLDNSRPVASIILPANFFRDSVNNSMNLTQNSSDEDDLLNITWNFGDGNITRFENYSLIGTPDLATTKHEYVSGGIYTVTFMATEMNRTQTQSSSTSRTVYIFQPGINVMPPITSPASGTVYTNWVKFNASQSFIANCSTTMTGYNFTAGKLQCKYVHAPGIKTTPGYSLTITWNVKELDGSNSAGFPISGKWAENYTNVVEFSRYFGIAAKRSATLVLDYSA